MSDQIRRLDCRQMKCPMPIVQLAMALRSLQPGEQLLVEATDPAFLADVRAWSRMTGNPIDDEQDGSTKQVRVTKAAAR